MVIATREAREVTGITQSPIVHRTVDTEELVAFCPSCKTMETVPFTKEGLGKTRKFIQEDNKVYHLCGSNLPCRLLRQI